MNNEQMREDFEEHLTRNVSGLCTYLAAISKNPNGDYIIFDVGVDGGIAKWREPEITISGSDDDQSGWTLLAGKDIEP